MGAASVITALPETHATVPTAWSLLSMLTPGPAIILVNHRGEDGATGYLLTRRNSGQDRLA
jgi:hypothetical protein